MISKKIVGINNGMLMLYFFGLVAHIMMFLIFLYYRIDIMMYFNIVSIGVYFFLVLFCRNNKNTTIWNKSSICSLIEVTVHQVLALFCVGTSIGFQYFFIMSGIIIILQPENLMKKRLKIAACISITIIMIATTLHAEMNEPIYFLPNNVKQVMLIAVTLVSMFGIFAFSFNQWELSEHYRAQTEALLGARNVKINDMQEKIIRNFADIVEKRDGTTGGHIKRTSAYVKAIMNALSESGRYSETITPEYTKMVVSAAPLHDIGKISISDSILCKRGKLTKEEYDVMKTHSSVGGSMLDELLGNLESEEYVRLAAEISTYHHERWDGMGYPEGLSGTDIPLSARIMAVADVFDALTSERTYKEKYSLEKAYEIMTDEAGKQFDPVIIDEFKRIWSEICGIYTRFNGTDEGIKK